MSVPQTVSFELTVEYRHMARPLTSPTIVRYTFEKLEDMIWFFRKERKRRSYADRATGGTYRLILTDHGRDMINSADEHYTVERYADAIDGTEFPM